MTLSRKKPFNWVIAIICLFIPVIGWIALIMMIMAAGRGSEVIELRLAAGSPANLDDPEWVALSKYDPDISQAVAHLTPLGDAAVARFKDIYLRVKRKDAIPQIVNDIAAEAHLYIVEQGQLGRTKYELRANGTVLGHTPAGPKVFRSMAEFREYVGV